MLITIPEIIIRDTVEKIVRLVAIDYDSRTNEEDTILYHLLANQALKRYTLFDQSKTVFLKKEDDPRYIEVNVQLNRQRLGPPTIHIMLPSEEEVDMTLGIGEGELDYIFDEDDDTKYKRTFNKRFKANYNIVITSDNVNEVILIYNILRAGLMATNEHFQTYGLFNFRLSGRDLMIDPGLVPPHIVMRSIGVSFEYSVGSMEYKINDYLKDFSFTGVIDANAVNDIDESVSTS